MADRIAAVLLLIFAVYTMAVGRDMGFARGRVPGPGFAPFWIGLALAVAAVAILIESRRKRGSVQDSSDVSSPAHQVFAMSTATIAAVALIGPLGMFAALALMLVTMTRVLGAAWRTSVLTAVALPIALHLVFGVWLKVPLPRGPWGF